MKSGQSVLTQFHPLVARWFEERVGQPTDVQQQAWPKIAAKEHLLITAPTGTGKGTSGCCQGDAAKDYQYPLCPPL